MVKNFGTESHKSMVIDQKIVVVPVQREAAKAKWQLV
ncbi:MAG: hypothetical protein CM1200mP28_12100 [Deltaproteobacteria bacterium]|nr:MAG: hypothetical protein CM1200mP28_12100 [Deltaproteobacteria bacterium]